jgi:hypothetical protein
MLLKISETIIKCNYLTGYWAEIFSHTIKRSNLTSVRISLLLALVNIVNINSNNSRCIVGKDLKVKFFGYNVRDSHRRHISNCWPRNKSYTEFGGIYMFYIRTKFHVPNFSGSLDIASKPRVQYRYHAATMLHNTKYVYFSKIYHYTSFQDAILLSSATAAPTS